MAVFYVIGLDYCRLLVFKSYTHCKLGNFKVNLPRHKFDCICVFTLLTLFIHYFQIVNLAFQSMTFGHASSKCCAKSVCMMTKLHSLQLQRVKLDGKFFSVLSESGSSSQVR